MLTSGQSHNLIKCYEEYLGSRYTHWLLEDPTFDVWLLKLCLQKTASFEFGPLDPFWTTEFIITRLKGAEHRDWMQVRQSPEEQLRQSIFFYLG